MTHFDRLLGGKIASRSRAAVLLCMFSSMLAAQTETIISARGEERTAPWHAQGAGWSAGVDNGTFQAILKIDEQHLELGKAVDYELVVTNTGSQTVLIPRTLDWKDIDYGSPEQRYNEAKVVFELSTKEEFTDLSPTLNLYSVDEKPSTQLILDPGDSVRILGTTVLPASPFGPNRLGELTLTAHFCVSSIQVASSESSRKQSGVAKHMRWCVAAGPKYEMSSAKP